MKKDSVKLLIIVIVGLLIYLSFFVEEVSDTPIKNDYQKIEVDSMQVRVDTLLNEKGYLVIGKPNEVKLISKSDATKFRDFHKVGFYKNDIFIAKYRDVDHLEIYKEKSEFPSFETYSVPLFKGKLAEPDFSSNDEAKQFMTRIKEGCKQGVNFAGQYTLIYWGCGTACQYGVVVDRKTGKIYTEYSSSMGSEFKKDSQLILINSGFFEENETYIPLYQFKKIAFKTWINNRFEQIN